MESKVGLTVYVYVACVVQYLSHIVVTHCVWPVSIAFTLWFLLSLFCGVVHVYIDMVLPVLGLCDSCQ